MNRVVVSGLVSCRTARPCTRGRGTVGHNGSIGGAHREMTSAAILPLFPRFLSLLRREPLPGSARRAFSSDLPIRGVSCKFSHVYLRL